MLLNDLKSLYGDWTQIITLLDEEASYACDHGDISGYEPLFDFNISDLLEIMYLENAPTKVRRSVMMFLESEWQRFSPTQIEELRTALNIIYLDVRHDDLGVQFLIVELLAKYYHDARSLGTLINFAQNTTGQRKALACAGAGMFAMKTSDASKRKEVIRLLEAMKKDTSQDVRQEAKHYLYRIKIISK